MSNLWNVQTKEHTLTTSRIPPHAVEIEQAVLGAALLEQEALIIVLDELSADDFYRPGHQAIFRAMYSLFNQGKETDFLSVENYLRDSGEPELNLSELTRSVSSAAHAQDHCRIISGKAQRRRLIQACSQAINQAYDNDLSTDQVLDDADSRIFEIINGQDSNRTYEGKIVIQDALQHLINIQGSKDGVTGIATGLTVDSITSGWQRGDFILVAARPSMGKTALALHILQHTAKNYGSAGLLSLEMSYKSLGTRLIVSKAAVDGQRARRGQLTDSEIDKIHDAAGKLLELGIVVDDTTFVSEYRLRTKAKAMKHKYDIQVLIVDYLQLLTSDKDVREQQVASISRTAKAIAKELDIPVIGLSQLNRSCESRHGIGKRPQLSDLRESGALEQDADVVCFLFRPEYYGIKTYPDSEPKKWAGKSTENICEIIVGKQRSGPTGMARVLYLKESMRFENYTHEPWYKHSKN